MRQKNHYKVTMDGGKSCSIVASNAEQARVVAINCLRGVQSINREFKSGKLGKDCSNMAVKILTL